MNDDAFKVNSLRDPETANPVESEVVWDVPRSLWNAAMLITALVFAAR